MLGINELEEYAGENANYADELYEQFRDAGNIYAGYLLWLVRHSIEDDERSSDLMMPEDKEDRRMMMDALKNKKTVCKEALQKYNDTLRVLRETKADNYKLMTKWAVRWLDKAHELMHMIFWLRYAKMVSQNQDEDTDERIISSVFDGCKPEESPVTVFVGGQPGAGKTYVQNLLFAEDKNIVRIISDEFEAMHPDFAEIMNGDSLCIPDKTADFTEKAVGACIDHAMKNDYSCLIEDTWSDKDKVLQTAEDSRSRGRKNTAVIVIAPHDVSQMAMLERYFADMGAFYGHWTIPASHEEACRNITDTMREIKDSGLFSRFIAVTKEGKVLYDGDDPAKWYDVWASAKDVTTEKEAVYARDSYSYIEYEVGNDIGCTIDELGEIQDWSE